jgi:hypothetical protein
MKLTPELRKKLQTNTTAHGLVKNPKVKAAFEQLPTEALELFVSSGRWRTPRRKQRCQTATYRLRRDWQPPVEKMQPPWDVLVDEIICVVRDPSGVPYGYDSCPTASGTIWINPGARAWKLSCLKFPLGEEDWDLSLVWRPGHEPEGQ